MWPSFILEMDAECCIGNQTNKAILGAIHIVHLHEPHMYFQLASENFIVHVLCVSEEI